MYPTSSLVISLLERRAASVAIGANRFRTRRYVVRPAVPAVRQAASSGFRLRRRLQHHREQFVVQCRVVGGRGLVTKAVRPGLVDCTNVRACQLTVALAPPRLLHPAGVFVVSRRNANGLGDPNVLPVRIDPGRTRRSGRSDRRAHISAATDQREVALADELARPDVALGCVVEAAPGLRGRPTSPTGCTPARRRRW